MSVNIEYSFIHQDLLKVESAKKERKKVNQSKLEFSYTYVRTGYFQLTWLNSDSSFHNSLAHVSHSFNILISIPIRHSYVISSGYEISEFFLFSLFFFFSFSQPRINFDPNDYSPSVSMPFVKHANTIWDVRERHVIDDTPRHG